MFIPSNDKFERIYFCFHDLHPLPQSVNPRFAISICIPTLQYVSNPSFARLNATTGYNNILPQVKRGGDIAPWMNILQTFGFYTWMGLLVTCSVLVLYAVLYFSFHPDPPGKDRVILRRTCAFGTEYFWRAYTYYRTTSHFGRQHARRLHFRDLAVASETLIV